jgi:putative transposase
MENEVVHPVATKCRVLVVSPSGFYAWSDRPKSDRAKANKALLEKFTRFHEASRGTYGCPRIMKDLVDDKEAVGHNRVARLMREAGIRGISRRKECWTTIRGKDARPAPDLVGRKFVASGPNRLWVADITYVPTWAGFLYLAVVLDVWSRRIIGWAMANHLRSEVVLQALDMAIWQRKSENVIHHSDQGCQYTSLAFGQRCREAGIQPSMGSVGDAYDNAMAESFFATLECELLNRHRFRTQVEARMAIFEFIEGWYNQKRRHSALDYRSPIEFEKAAESGIEEVGPTNDFHTDSQSHDLVPA